MIVHRKGLMKNRMTASNRNWGPWKDSYCLLKNHMQFFPQSHLREKRSLNPTNQIKKLCLNWSFKKLMFRSDLFSCFRDLFGLISIEILVILSFYFNCNLKFASILIKCWEITFCFLSLVPSNHSYLLGFLVAACLNDIPIILLSGTCFHSYLSIYAV